METTKGGRKTAPFAYESRWPFGPGSVDSGNAAPHRQFRTRKVQPQARTKQHAPFSIVEQVGMGSGAGEFQAFVLDAVEQEPVWFDV